MTGTMFELIKIYYIKPQNVRTTKYDTKWQDMKTQLSV